MRTPLTLTLPPLAESFTPQFRGYTSVFNARRHVVSTDSGNYKFPVYQTNCRLPLAMDPRVTLTIFVLEVDICLLDSFRVFFREFFSEFSQNLSLFFSQGIPMFPEIYEFPFYISFLLLNQDVI